ncbi:hypothetical protein [Caloranaerobacter ferrireducens]|uniref:hypothetical protein n=1 Tax=Caloranaerobacter ferrireducens TaxID=1323370 RepID=UPI00084D1080|nr:hypothetical protein [Caloranaerobacter ferrireducens]
MIDRRLWILRIALVILLIIMTLFYLYIQPIHINKRFQAIRYSTINKEFLNINLDEINEYTHVKANINWNFYTIIDGLKFHKYFQGKISIYEGRSENIIYVYKAYLGNDNVYKGEIFLKGQGSTKSGLIFIDASGNEIKKILVFYHIGPTTYELISIPSETINQAFEVYKFFY